MQSIPIQPLTIEPLCTTNEGEDEGNGLISLRVCQDCQSSLMGAFNHCLSQHSPSVRSIHEIDPIVDGQLTSEQPYFDIVQDPTVAFVRTDKVAKDRYLFAQNQMAKDKTGVISTKAGANVAKGFSGALYKRMLHHKDKQIQGLQSQIYEQDLVEGAHEKNVELLKKALNKAVKYYTFAEEWQKKQSERLEKDVFFLKAELSSMMAFLINAQEEKRTLKREIEEINDLIKRRDITIIDMGKAEEQLSLKLHGSFKELISMNETMKRLEKEAEKGNDAAEKRNQLLQKNLDKLGSEFTATTQNLNVATLRVREVEFEIEEIINQFNSIGELKKKAEELNNVLSDDLAATSHALNNTKDQLEQTISIKELLVTELKLTRDAQESLKIKLENQISQLQRDLTQSEASCSNLELVKTNLTLEVSTLNASLKSMKRDKETVESNFKAAKEKSNRDIQARDVKISEHEAARAENAKKIKVITEMREKMRSEVTELQNALDREASSHNVVSFEYSQFKRQAEERFLSFEEQIEKLSSAKANLSNEKKHLAERLKEIKSKLADKEQELEYTTRAYKIQGDEAIAKETNMGDKIASLELSLAQLQSKHKELTANFVNSQNTTANLSHDLDVTGKRLAEFEEKDRLNCANIADLESKLAHMIQSHNQAVQERVAMKIHLDSVLSKFEELNSTIRNMDAEFNSTTKYKDGLITKFSNDLQHARDEIERLLSISTQLKKLSETLDADLLHTRNNLQNETFRRESLETELQNMTDKFNMERKIRNEFERMNSRIGRIDELRSLERIAALRMRDFKLKEVDTGLTQELDHLNSLVALLPDNLNFGEVDAQPISIFNDKSSRRKTVATHTTRK